MRATVFVAILGAIAMLLALTAVAWKRGDWGLVLFGIALILLCASAIPDLLKTESMKTAEQLRDSDDQLFSDAADQFFETKFQKQVKIGVAIFLAAIGLIGFVVYLVWGGV